MVREMFRGSILGLGLLSANFASAQWNCERLDVEDDGATHQTAFTTPLAGSSDFSDGDFEFATSSGSYSEDDENPNEEERYQGSAAAFGEAFIETFNGIAQAETSVSVEQQSTNAYTALDGWNAGGTYAEFEFNPDPEATPPYDPETERHDMTGVLALDFTISDPTDGGYLLAYAVCGDSWISLENPGAYVGVIGYVDENNDYTLEAVSGSGYTALFYFTQPIGAGVDFAMETYAAVGLTDGGTGETVASSAEGTATAYTQSQITQL
jgi:hypothetical protein